MPKIDLSNLKPQSLGFYACTICETGDTPHTVHDGPWVRIDGTDLDEYWANRSQYASARAWYIEEKMN